MFFILIAMQSAFIASAQLEMRSWRSHLPMNTFNMVDDLPGFVFAANRFGVLVYDREEGSSEALTKVTSLSQTGISCLRCDFENSICVVGYTNGNIDVIDAQKNVTNQPAITNSSVVGDKTIYDVVFQDGAAMLLTGIGVVKMELSTLNVLEYGQLFHNGNNLPVMRGLDFGDALFFASSDGIFQVNWNTIFGQSNLTQLTFSRSASFVKQLFTFKEEVYLLFEREGDGNDTLFRLENDEFIAIPELAGSEMRHVDTKGGRLLMTGRERIYEYDSTFAPINSIFGYGAEAGIDGQRAVYSEETNQALVADGIHGLALVSMTNQYNGTLANISSPKDGNMTVLVEAEGSIYAMAGGSEFTFNTGFLYDYTDAEWSTRLMYSDKDQNVTNPMDIAVEGDQKYLVFDRSGFMRLNNQNEILEHITDDENMIGDPKDGYYGISGVEIDDDGHVWMINNKAEATLSVMDPEGNYNLINIPEYQAPVTSYLRLLSSGILAFALRGQAVVLYDPNDTPMDSQDDRYVLITTDPDEGNLQNSSITDLAEDRDGELWIGTEEGIGIIYNPESAFESNFEGVQRVIVNQDGFNGYLFEADVVNCIAVDGANRKWVGARGAGLFLISEDGQEQLAHFTEEDSPLLNNNVLDVAIIPETGEVFIATESGLQSYLSDASESVESLGDVQVFPNPVKPGFNGDITFRNLTDEAYVRVTDVAGNLIFETQSFGGTATWDGRDARGQRVASGVYLVFAAGRDGQAGSITKLLMLK